MCFAGEHRGDRTSTIWIVFSNRLRQRANAQCSGTVFHHPQREAPSLNFNSVQFTCGQTISTVQPGSAVIVKPNPCSLTIAATKLRPRPSPSVLRLLSER